MADFRISGRMKVKTLKANFKAAFGSTLRVYKGQRFANDEATLVEIRKEGFGAGDATINGRTLVGNFEKKIMDEYGIRVQVALPDDSALVGNDVSLTQSGR